MIVINAVAEEAPNRTFACIFLIAAPFVGAGGWPSEEFEPRALHGLLLPVTTAIHLYHGSADEIAPCIAPCAHLELYEDAIAAAITHRLLGRDHQLNDDLSEVAAGMRALR